MATGKQTPRQKMINMMYLVLTAMLALNVSAEVLDAFVTVDASLNETITIIREKNNADLGDFVKAMMENRDKVEKWYVKADSVHTRANEMHDYLEHLKIKIIESGDGKNSKALQDSAQLNIAKIDAKDNTDAASRVMLGEMQSGDAYTLRKKIEEYKTYLLANMGEQSPVAASIERMLNTANPPLSVDGTQRSWETSRFESVPLVSAITILSKLQLDVVNCESEVLSYLRNQVDASDFKFSSIEAIVAPTSDYVIKGTEYTAKIYLAAYDPTQRPVLTVNGRVYEANNEGIIEFKSPATNVGPMNIPGKVTFKGVAGDTEKDVRMIYTVAEPNVVVSPTKMNVVYRGIENPLSISISGVPSDKLEARASGGGNIAKRDNGFFLRPGEGRTSEVSVWVDGKNMGAMSFRVKELPTPNAAIFGISGKSVSRGELVAAEGVVAEMKDFDFDLKYKVTGFTVAVVGGGGYTREEASKSELFTDKQKQMFAAVKSGERVMITDIKAVAPDGRSIDLYDFSIRVK